MKKSGKPTTEAAAPWVKKFAFLPEIVSIDVDGKITKVWFEWFETRSYIINQGKLTCRWVIENRVIGSKEKHTIYCPTISFYG